MYITKLAEGLFKPFLSCAWNLISRRLLFVQSWGKHDDALENNHTASKKSGKRKQNFDINVKNKFNKDYFNREWAFICSLHGKLAVYSRMD